jgi:hypothetical protein
MHIAAKWSMRKNGLRQIGLTAVFVVAASGMAAASDYVHQCRSADGGYVMNDEQLQAFDVAKGRETGRVIPYKVLRRTTLSKSAGYCIANKAPRGQRRYNHAAESYALHIRFRQNGQTIKTFMVCEMASSGLPAAYDCDREVTTLNWSIGKTAAAPSGNGNAHNAGGPRWMHNGSRVRIVADGRRRRIVFVTPNERLANKGVAPGDPVFVGRRKANRYIGKAYVYSKRCPTVSYGVRGRVHTGEARVVVTGRRPVRNRGCKTAYRQDVRLVFDRK